MIVQIYTVQSPEEGIALAELGVDHIGITPSDHGLPGEISNEYAAEIFAAIGERCQCNPFFWALNSVYLNDHAVLQFIL